MKCITVIATIQVKPESIDFMKKELCKLIRPTRRQRGNLSYSFYQNEENPCLFHSFEHWTTKKVIDEHLASPPLQSYFKATKEAVIDFKIEYFHQICS